jgi:CRP-like cAMP-binding protein
MQLRTESNANKFLEKFSIHAYMKGKIIAQEGQESHHAFIILSGEVLQYR